MPQIKRLLAAVVATALSLAAADGFAAPCMLANPSFETLGSGGQVFGGWNQFGPVALSTSAVHGSFGARVSGPNTGTWNVSGVWQSLPCTPGQRFAVSTWVQHSSASPLTGGSQAILNIEWRDAADNLLSYESHAAATASTPTDTWGAYSVQSAAAPAGTASIHYVLGVLQGPTDPTPVVTFDEANLSGVGPTAPESLQWGDFASGRTVQFSGRTWRVKGPGYYGPGPNLFDNGTGAVSVDSVGQMHLTIHKIGSNWYSSEVALVEALGYGDYVFTTRGRLDLLDRNTVFGLFIWEYGACYDNAYLWWNPFNEIDVEIGRWGNAAGLDAQFVAQPASNSGNLFRFNIAFGDTERVRHAMRWLPQRVEFRSWRGGPDDESAATRIATWTYSGANLPRPEMPRVHLNMWQLAAPTTLQEAVINAFTFRPICPTGTCGVLGGDPPPAPSAGVTAAAPNPFASGTTIRYSTALAGVAELTVLDVAGRRVRDLVNGPVGAGPHAAEWNGRDDAGRRVAPGVYFYRLRAPGIADTKRMVVLE